MAAPLIIHLGLGTEFRIDPEARSVETRWRDGRHVGVSLLDTEENRSEARAHGYLGPDPCWRFLVEHELLHTMISRICGWGESRVLRDEGSRGDCLLEEGVVLVAQRLLNGGPTDPLITMHPAIMPTALLARSLIPPEAFAPCPSTSPPTIQAAAPSPADTAAPCRGRCAS